MLSVKRRQNRTAIEEQSGTSPLPMPGIAQYSPVEQRSFPDASAIPDGALSASQQFPQYNFPATNPINDGRALPEVYGVVPGNGRENRQLMEIQTGPVPALPATPTTTSLRTPVVIRGSRKKSSGTMLPPRPQGKRLFLHSTVTILLVLLVVGALFAVLPIGPGHASGLSLLNLPISMVPAKNTNSALIGAQIATATAVTQDGYDPGGGLTYAGVNSAPTTSQGSLSASDIGSLNRFFYGQCTYWANMRYHQLTGHWVPWLGNAAEWKWGALNNGWVVSNTPNPNGPSIIVLQPYIQGAGYYGHVAVVESGTTATTVSTSNWNWAGRWGQESWVDFSVGGGVSFVWYPGA